MSHASHSKYETWYRYKKQEKQLILNLQAHSFYTTNVSSCKPYIIGKTPNFCFLDKPEPN